MLILLLLLVCRPAAAEKAAVLVPDADWGIRTDLVELTQWLVADWIKERGVELLMPQEAAPSLTPDLRHCRAVDCASRYLDKLESVDYAVVTKISQSEQGNGGRIEVVLVSVDGERYSQAWPVGAAIELAIDAALTHAYTAFLSAQSKRKSNRKTEVEAQEVNLEAVTQPEPEVGNAQVAIDSYSDQPEPRSSAWNYIIGGGLLAGSVALLLPSIYVAARHDECKEEDKSGRCIRYYFGEFSIAELSLGVASLLTGTLFILFEPITVKSELSVGDGQGVIRLSGAF